MKRILQDAHWKELLNIKMVVREILSAYVRQDLLEHFDLDRLERYPTEHVKTPADCCKTT